MFSRLFISKWKPYTIAESSAKAGCASVVLRDFDCEINETNGKKKFIGDFGVFFADWIDAKWNDEGNSTYRMLSGSPWRWRAEIKEFKPFNIEITYHTEASKRQMVSDTLDAIIAILEKK